MSDYLIDQEVLGWMTWPFYASQDANRDPDKLGQEMYGPGLMVRLLEAFQGDPIGYETVTVGANAVALAKVPDFARSATMIVETLAVRIRLDGTPPTTAVGLLVPTATIFTVTGRKSLKGFQVIQATGAASIGVQYFD
jgi:hypothetical protein